MEITVQEALSLLRGAGKRVADARAEAQRAEDMRDALIRQLDGQPGMVRREMCDALGLSKMRLSQIAGERAPERERILDAVPMDAELYESLTAVVGHFARTVRDSEGVRFDVDA